MIHPTKSVLLTAMSPLGTISWQARRLAVVFAGSSLLAGTSLATDNVWLGTTTDWNTAANWSLTRVPVMPNGDPAPADNFDDAIINSQANNIALITATIPALRDIKVGTGTGTDGRVDHTAGTAATGGGNWMRVGTDAGRGVYNLANTAVSGAGVSGFGQGAGSLTVGGRLYVGGDGAGGSNGTLNVNTTGTVNIATQLQVGAGGTGVLNLESGAVTTGGEWVEFGNGANSSGTLNMSGGSLIKNGNDNMAFGTNGGIGVANHSGGTLTNNNEFWVGQAGGSNGTYNLSGSGRVETSNWVAIGRAGGTGTLNISGGSFSKTGGGEFIVGDNSTGTLTMTGGVLNANNQFWVGQAGSGVGRMSVSAGTVTVGNWIAVGREGANGVLTISGTALIQKGTEGSFEIGNNAASNGTVHLDGGTLAVDEVVTGGGSSTFNFNGGTLKAIVSAGNFMQGLTNANVKAGGAKIDTNGFDVTINQVLKADADSTGGGLVKTGGGTLTLGGTNTYTGLTSVTSGRLVVLGSIAGGVTVDAGATLGGSGNILGVVQIASGATVAPGTSPGTLSTGSLSLSAGTSLEFELGTPGTVGGGVNDLISVTGNLTLDGTLQILPLAGFANGTYRLFDYTGSLTDNGLTLDPSFLASFPGSAIDTGTANQVNLTVVPEPGATLTALAALGLLAGRRRRSS